MIVWILRCLLQQVAKIGHSHMLSRLSLLGTFSIHRFGLPIRRQHRTMDSPNSEELVLIEKSVYVIVIFRLLSC